MRKTATFTILAAYLSGRLPSVRSLSSAINAERPATLSLRNGSYFYIFFVPVLKSLR